MKKFLLLLLTVFSLVSCKQYENINLKLFYSDHTTGELFFDGKKEFSIEDQIKLAESDYSMAVKYLFDAKVNQLWICSLGKRSNLIILFKYDEEDFIKKSIIMNFDSTPYICGISNNIILNCINSANKEYELISISNLGRKKIRISIDQPLLLPIGFYDNRIFFSVGYFDISENIFKFYQNKHQYKRIIDQSKYIALDEFNEIVIYDIDKNETIKTGIFRKLFVYARYTPENLYFIKNDILFYSKDYFLLPAIRKLLPIWYTKTKWYGRNLLTGEEKRVLKIGNKCSVVCSQ